MSQFGGTALGRWKCRSRAQIQRGRSSVDTLYATADAQCRGLVDVSECGESAAGDQSGLIRSRDYFHQESFRELLCLQIDIGRRTPNPDDKFHCQRQRADHPERSKIDRFQPQRIFGGDDCICARCAGSFGPRHLLRKEREPDEVATKPTCGFTRGPVLEDSSVTKLTTIGGIVI
jgi:hypothetical protein